MVERDRQDWGELIRSQVEAREAEAFRTFSSFLLHDLKNFASTLSMISKNAAQHGAIRTSVR